MIKAIVLDDEPLSLDLIETFCEKSNEVDLVKKFTSPIEALKYLRKFPVDLIFLDIKMPTISGLDFLEKISQKIEVILITAYSEYAVESYNFNAIDYLLKPFEYERFIKAISKVKAKKNTEKLEDKFLSIRSEYRLIKVNLTAILHIESNADYLTIFSENQKPIVTRMTMKDMLDELPSNDFIRVHRSFIVPISKINIIRDKKIILDHTEIPIGVNYEKIVGNLFII